MFRIVRHGLALIVIALLMAACNNGGDGPAGPEASDSLPADTPAVEGSGPEEPASGGNDGPAIPTAGLPIGGDSDEGPAERQCIQVSWLGEDEADLTDGIRVKVTKVRTDDSKRFKVSDFGCPDTSCRSFIFTADNRSCYVAVTVNATYPARAKLLMDGQVLCPSGHASGCRKFTKSLVRQSIRIYAPEGTEPTPGETETDPEPSASTD